MDLVVPVDLNLKPLPPNLDAVLETLLEDAPKASGTIDHYGWADEEEELGRTVRSSDSEHPGDTGFTIGDGLEVRGDKLFAPSAGIVRVGKDWIDLVACRLHCWELNGGQGEDGCFLNFRPGNPNLGIPPVHELIAAAAKIGFLPEKLLPENEIRAVLAHAVEKQQTLDNYPISKNLDARISLEIDPDQLKAELLLRKGSGHGRPLELNNVAEVIRNSGLRGLDGPAVKAAILQFHKGDEKSTRILLKEGKAPKRGPDRELAFSLPFVDDEELEAIRQRMLDGDKVRGVLSLDEFSPDSITAMALAKEGASIATLKSAVLGASGRDIYGKLLPGLPGNDPNITLYEGLDWQEGSVVATESGILDIAENPDGAFQLRVRPHQDALITVNVSPDALHAMVSIRPPLGTGAPADKQRIRDAAEEANVVKGLLDDAIERVVELSHTGQIVTGELIAEGRLPMEDNTRLSLKVEGDPAKAPVPVKQGDTIGEIQTDDESGWNVHGELITGNGERGRTGEYIDRREMEEGRTVLIAEKSGHLVMENGKLSIQHLLDYVGDVSLATGNIRFPGKIKVEGSVLSRVVLDAGDSIEITEVVQAALVNSGADIRIGKGIKGEGKAVLRCQGDLSFSYAEDANILATGNIWVAKALMNCRVKCNGKLSIPGDKGKLLGGVMKLKDGLDIYDVGNERGVETVVSFGQDYLVENQIDQIIKEQGKIQEFINKADKLMAEQERKGSQNGLISLRRKKVDALKLLNKKNLRLFLLKENFEKHFDSSIVVRGTIFPGVIFESHGRVMKITEPVHRAVITFNAKLGRLERRPIS